MSQTASILTSLAVKKSFEAMIAPLTAQIDAELDSFLASAELVEGLREALRYSALGGGKRLRPILVVLACEAVGGDRLSAMPAACAMELIHCFSLVHDDLPAMDDDDVRRGQPTLHIHAGEAMAILAGDAMVSLAFQLVSQGAQSSDVRAQLVSELAIATTRMINGQVYDTLGGFPAAMSPPDCLHLIHTNKTAALLSASCRMGGLCGGASKQQLAALTTYGDAIGLMFQIIDDVLDVTQSAEHVGKATGKDIAAGKLTYPGVMGMDRSQHEVERLHGAARDALAELGSAAMPLHHLCDAMAIRTK